MSGEIAFANTALESFAALVTFVLLFACIAKIKMQRGIKHVTSKDTKRNTLDYILIIWLVIHMIVLTADVLSWTAMDFGKNEVWLYVESDIYLSLSGMYGLYLLCKRDNLSTREDWKYLRVSGHAVNSDCNHIMDHQ